MQLTRIAIGLGLFLAGGCATGAACTRDPITGQSRCQQASGSYVEAAGTAVAAVAAWGVVGCTVNDCEPPFRCNRDTKLCERIRCSEGRNSCPPAYNCDPVDQVCK
jgi:hypothetical protein